MEATLQGDNEGANGDATENITEIAELSGRNIDSGDKNTNLIRANEASKVPSFQVECAERITPLEQALHWGGWIFGCLYSTYLMQQAISKFSSDGYEYYAPGLINGYKRDRFDTEFEVVAKGQMPRFVSAMIIHIFTSFALKKLNLVNYLPAFHFAMSSCYLFWSVGIFHYIVLVTTALSIFAVSRLRNRLICWWLVLGFLLTDKHLIEMTAEFAGERNPLKRFLTRIIFMWNLCRGVMFSCDQADRPPAMAHHDNLITFLGFTFYGPTLLGPLLAHEDYLASLTTIPSSPPLRDRLYRLVKSLLRLASWILFLEVSNHFIHYHALSLQMDNVARLFGRWEMVGLNYWAGQFFYIKYVVLYGIPTALATFEGVSMPLEPRCMSSMASYRDVWRYFDNGLYRFMKRHVFLQVSGPEPSRLRHFLGSAVVFLFVYAWHGLHRYGIFVWSMANFVCVTVEKIGNDITSSALYRQCRRRGGSGVFRRLEALARAPLYLVTLAAQVGFVTGSFPLGQLCASRMLTLSPLTEAATLIAFMYCGCQVSLDVKQWYQKRRSGSATRRKKEKES